MTADTLKDDVVQLQFVAAADDALTERFAAEHVFSATGLQSAPSRERLVQLCREERLKLWQYGPVGGGPLGFAGLVYFDGPPHLFIAPFEQPIPDLQHAQSIVLLLAPKLFADSDHSALFMYVDQPVPDAVHASLIEAGFDPFEDCPTIDPAQEAAYVLERHTYEAYYGEGVEDF